MKPVLTIDLLLREATTFAEAESSHAEPLLFGVNDGKSVGTYLEHKFVSFLALRYSFAEGNSALGIDLPSLEIDIKVTSARQPQSSCPFRSARQKIYGLGYHLLIFVYEKMDDHVSQTGRLTMKHTIFVDRTRTDDFQTTSGLLKVIQNEGNIDDVTSFIMERHLPVDEIGAQVLAEEILSSPPNVGYLTISNAQQWRLQYGRVIAQAGIVDGITKVR